MYGGCISGALQKQVYLELIHAHGFENIIIQKEKPIYIPDDILVNHLSAVEIESFRKGGIGIFSITVYEEAAAGNPEQKRQVADKRKV